MRRVICWFKGHEQVYSFPQKWGPQGGYIKVIVSPCLCLRCGAALPLEDWFIHGETN